MATKQSNNELYTSSSNPFTDQAIEQIYMALLKPSQSRSYDDLLLLKSYLSKTEFVTKNLAGIINPRQMSDICRSLGLERYYPQDVIFQQGDMGDKVYIVLTGSCDVRVRYKIDLMHGQSEIREKHIVTYTPGQFFGERALQFDEPRSATVICLERSELVTIHKSIYLQVINEARDEVPLNLRLEQFGTKEGVVKILSKIREKRTNQELDAVAAYLYRRIPFFQRFSISQLIELCRVAETVTIWGRSILFKQGQLGQAFYVILTGTVEVWVNDAEDSPGLCTVPQTSDIMNDNDNADGKHNRSSQPAMSRPSFSESNLNHDNALGSNPPSQENNHNTTTTTATAASTTGASNRRAVFNRSVDITEGLGSRVNQLVTGDVFGERALESEDSLRMASIITGEDNTELLIISKEDYHNLVYVMMHSDSMAKLQLLRKTELFRSLDVVHLRALARFMEPKRFQIDEEVVSAGKRATEIIIIEKGECRAVTEVVEGFDRKTIAERRRRRNELGSHGSTKEDAGDQAKGNKEDNQEEEDNQVMLEEIDCSLKGVSFHHLIGAKGAPISKDKEEDTQGDKQLNLTIDTAKQSKKLSSLRRNDESEDDKLRQQILSVSTPKNLNDKLITKKSNNNEIRLSKKARQNTESSKVKKKSVNLGRIAPHSVLAAYIVLVDNVHIDVYHPETVLASSLVSAFTIGKTDFFNHLPKDSRDALVKIVADFKKPVLSILWDNIPRVIDENQWRLEKTWSKFRQQMVQQRHRNHNILNTLNYFRHYRLSTQNQSPPLSQRDAQADNYDPKHASTNSTALTSSGIAVDLILKGGHRNMRHRPHNDNSMVHSNTRHNASTVVTMEWGLKAEDKAVTIRSDLSEDKVKTEELATLDNKLLITAPPQPSLLRQRLNNSQAQTAILELNANITAMSRPPNLTEDASRLLTSISTGQNQLVGADSTVTRGLHKLSARSHHHRHGVQHLIERPFLLIHIHRDLHRHNPGQLAAQGGRRLVKAYLRILGTYQTCAKAKEVSDLFLEQAFLTLYHGQAAHESELLLQWQSFKSFESISVTDRDLFLIYCRSAPLEYATLQSSKNLFNMNFPAICRTQHQRYCVAVMHYLDPNTTTTSMMMSSAYRKNEAHKSSQQTTQQQGTSSTLSVTASKDAITIDDGDDRLPTGATTLTTNELECNLDIHLSRDDGDGYEREDQKVAEKLVDKDTEDDDDSTATSVQNNSQHSNGSNMKSANRTNNVHGHLKPEQITTTTNTTAINTTTSFTSVNNMLSNPNKSTPRNQPINMRTSPMTNIGSQDQTNKSMLSNIVNPNSHNTSSTQLPMFLKEIAILNEVLVVTPSRLGSIRYAVQRFGQMNLAPHQTTSTQPGVLLKPLIEASNIQTSTSHLDHNSTINTTYGDSYSNGLAANTSTTSLTTKDRILRSLWLDEQHPKRICILPLYDWILINEDTFETLNFIYSFRDRNIEKILRAEAFEDVSIDEFDRQTHLTYPTSSGLGDNYVDSRDMQDQSLQPQPQQQEHRSEYATQYHDDFEAENFHAQNNTTHLLKSLSEAGLIQMKQSSTASNQHISTSSIHSSIPLPPSNQHYQQSAVHQLHEEIVTKEFVQQFQGHSDKNHKSRRNAMMSHAPTIQPTTSTNDNISSTKASSYSSSRQIQSEKRLKIVQEQMKVISKLMDQHHQLCDEEDQPINTVNNNNKTINDIRKFHKSSRHKETEINLLHRRLEVIESLQKLPVLKSLQSPTNPTNIKSYPISDNLKAIMNNTNTKTTKNNSHTTASSTSGSSPYSSVQQFKSIQQLIYTNPNYPTNHTNLNHTNPAPNASVKAQSEDTNHQQASSQSFHQYLHKFHQHQNNLNINNNSSNIVSNGNNMVNGPSNLNIGKKLAENLRMLNDSLDLAYK